MASKKKKKVSPVALQQRAAALNLSWSDFGDVAKKYGPDVLDLIKSLIQAGFSKQWVLDTLEKLGPQVLAFIESWVGQKSSLMAQGAIGTDVVKAFLPFVIKFVLKQVLPPNLQPLVDQFGDQIVAWVLSLLDTLSKNIPVPAPLPGTGTTPSTGTPLPPVVLNSLRGGLGTRRTRRSRR